MQLFSYFQYTFLLIISRKKTGNQNVILREIYEIADRKSDIMQRCISFYTFIAVPILYVIPIAYKSYHAYYTVEPTPFAFQLFYHVAYVFFCRIFHFLNLIFRSLT